MNNSAELLKTSPPAARQSGVAFVFALFSSFFFAAALFYAPLAYGCTRPEMWPPLFAFLLASIVSGLMSFVVDCRWPAIPTIPLLCVVAVLVQGWWLTWSPIFPSLVLANGGTVNTTWDNIQRLSFESMVLTSFTLISFLVVCGLFIHASLRRLILLAAAISGALICMIGDFLKLTGTTYMHHFWTVQDIYWNDFAFYRYQGNAGAFLNLVWPLILVFTRRAYTPTGSIPKKVVWTLCSLACGSALFLNASKAALVIGLLILPWPFMTRLLRMKAKTFIIVAGCFVLLVTLGLVTSSHFVEKTSFQRLTNATDFSGSFGGRMEAYRQYIDALPDVGLFGFGPGLYQVAFPYQNSPLGNINVGLREYAHQDYLQTVLEWGWVGTFWWTLLVGGGLYRAIKSYLQRDLFTSKTERHLVLAGMLGIGGTLVQAMVDFPLQIASLRLYFLLLLALCWASPKILATPPQVPTPPRKRFRLPIPSDDLIKASSRLTTSSR